MLAKCSVFIATSLDGFIAREDGSIDWLMGRHSYEKVLTFDPWPYGDLPTVVMSSQKISIPEGLQNSVFISSETPTELVKRLTNQGLKHLYIDGGITIQNFIKENLIDDLTITLIPVLLGTGRRLFGELLQDVELKHIETHSYDGGFVQVKYKIG